MGTFQMVIVVHGKVMNFLWFKMLDIGICFCIIVPTSICHQDSYVAPTKTYTEIAPIIVQTRSKALRILVLNCLLIICINVKVV